MSNDFPKQGSPEWFARRLGKATASKFKDMMTNDRSGKKMGQTALSYMFDLIAERVTGKPQFEMNLRALDWGHDNEPQARATYCLVRDVHVIPAGFEEHPTIPNCGGSPDGLVEGDDDGPGGVEIKCPMVSRIHLQYIYDSWTCAWDKKKTTGVPTEYQWQGQGLMWGTGREGGDFLSFDPRMEEALKMYVYRERKDEEAHKKLTERAVMFLEELESKLDAIRAKQTGEL